MSVQQQDNTPWYRQFWPWFLLAPLALSVILGTSMLVMSIQSYDGLVRDNYYKDGLAINQELQKDHRATELGLQAQLKLDEVTGELLVSLSGQLENYPQQLSLALIHPTVADRDRSLTLHHQVDGTYHTQLRTSLQHRRYLQLAPAAGSDWRLKGEATFPLTAAITLAAKPVTP